MIEPAPQPRPRTAPLAEGVPDNAPPRLLVVPDFATAEAKVANGTNSSQIVVLAGQDEVAARAAATAGLAAGRGPVPVRPHVVPWRTLVVVPTYNEKDNLAPLVSAIRAYLDTDVLVVDDGSPDGTGGIADGLAAADPRIHVLHREG